MIGASLSSSVQLRLLWLAKPGPVQWKQSADGDPVSLQAISPGQLTISCPFVDNSICLGIYDTDKQHSHQTGSFPLKYKRKSSPRVQTSNHKSFIHSHSWLIGLPDVYVMPAGHGGVIKWTKQITSPGHVCIFLPIGTVCLFW